MGVENATTEVTKAVEPVAPETPAASPAGAVATPAVPADNRPTFDELKRIDEQQRRERDEARRDKQEAARMKAEVEAKLKDVEAFTKKLKADPIAALHEQGITYEQLTERVLTGNKPDPQAQLVAAVDKRVAEVEARSQAQVASLRDEVARVNYEQYIEGQLKDPKFELLAGNPVAAKVAAERGWQHFKATGEMLTSDQVLGKLQTEWEGSIKQLSTSKAVRRVLGLSEVVPPVPTPTPTPGAIVAPANGGKASSMTGELSATPSAQGKAKVLSDAEELREAMKLIPAGVFTVE